MWSGGLSGLKPFLRALQAVRPVQPGRRSKAASSDGGRSGPSRSSRYGYSWLHRPSTEDHDTWPSNNTTAGHQLRLARRQLRPYTQQPPPVEPAFPALGTLLLWQAKGVYCQDASPTELATSTRVEFIDTPSTGLACSQLLLQARPSGWIRPQWTVPLGELAWPRRTVQLGLHYDAAAPGDVMLNTRRGFWSDVLNAPYRGSPRPTTSERHAGREAEWTARRDLRQGHQPHERGDQQHVFGHPERSLVGSCASL